MKICLDARKWFDGGIGVFIRLLAEQFTANGIEVITIARSNDRDAVAQTTRQPVFVCDAKNYSIRELLEVGKIANTTGAELYYAPHYVVPYGLTIPVVSLVHDTIQMEFPDQFSTVQRLYARFMIGRALRVSNYVITQSKTVRKDILQRFPATPADKIHPIRMVFDPQWMTAESAPPFPTIKQPYCVYFGAYRKHKNLSFLAGLWLESPELPPLVIVGDNINRYPELQNLSVDLLQNRRWFDAGELPFPELIRWVQNAFVSVFPSRYEGYGQPPLEAMACKVPAIVSDCGAFPEISGDGAKIISLEKPQEWVDEIHHLYDEGYRAQRIAQGQKWIEQFRISDWITEHIRVCQMTLNATEFKRTK